MVADAGSILSCSIVLPTTVSPLRLHSPLFLKQTSIFVWPIVPCFVRCSGSACHHERLNRTGECKPYGVCEDARQQVIKMTTNLIQWCGKGIACCPPPERVDTSCPPPRVKGQERCLLGTYAMPPKLPPNATITERSESPPHCKK